MPDALIPCSNAGRNTHPKRYITITTMEMDMAIEMRFRYEEVIRTGLFNMQN